VIRNPGAFRIPAWRWDDEVDRDDEGVCYHAAAMSMSRAPADEDSGKYPYWRRNQQVIPLGNLLCGLGFSLSWPFVPLMVRGLGVQENLETWVGYMLLVFYIVSFAANPVWGAIADHYGRKMMVLRAMLGMGLAMMIVPFASTPIWFATLFMLIGIFNGYTPAGVALIVGNTPPTRIGRAVSYAQTGGMVGQAFGPALGAVLAAMVDRQHWLFWISGGFMLSGGLLVACFVHEVKQAAHGPLRLQWIGNLQELLAVPRMGPLFFLSFLFSVMWYGSVTNISVFVLQLLASEAPDASAEAFWVGAAAMAMAFSMLIGLPLWGRVLDRIGAGKVLVFSAAATIVTHLPMLILQTPFQLVLTRIAFGLTCAAMPTAIFALLRAYAPKGMDARAISYSTAFHFIGMGLAPFIAGLISPAFGMRPYFALTIVAMAGGLALWRRGEKPASPSP
jgi:DHA1 family multidrug resistance protein-like MFS transporter